MRLAEAIRQATNLFEKYQLPEAAQEAEFFVRQVLEISLTDLVLKQEKELTPEQQTDFLKKAQRRAKGEPLAYIVGYKDFFKERFLVDPAVLIPRADTEILVEECLQLQPRPQRIADLGAGSGCIGLSLLKEWRQSHLTAVDVSQEALIVAKENARRLDLLSRVDFVLGDVLAQDFSEPFDLIVSNPPYIAPDDSRLENSVKNYEPHLALFAEEEGLFFYRRWTAWAQGQLSQGGWLLYECGEGQALDVQSICLQNGFKNIKIIKDLSAKDRVIAAQRSEHG
jgi:release factor glutamine methyltransferase